MKSEKEWVAELARECHTFPNELFLDDVNALIRRIQADALRKVLETAKVGFQNSSDAMEGAEHDEFFLSEGAALAYTYMKNYLNTIIKELESPK